MLVLCGLGGKEDQDNDFVSFQPAFLCLCWYARSPAPDLFPSSLSGVTAAHLIQVPLSKPMML